MVKRMPAGLGSLVLGLALAAQAPRLELGRPAPVGAALADAPDLAGAIAPLAAHLRARFGQVLVDCPAGLKRATAPGDSPLGAFVADAMRAGAARALGVPVRCAITNSGGLRRDLPAGPVRIEDVYEALPFENELVVAEYTGAELLAIVREGLLGKGGEPCSGLCATLAGDPDHASLAVAWSDGGAVDPAALYRVATNDYLLASGDATPTLRNGRRPVLTAVPVRQLVLDACARLGREGRPLRAPAERN